MNRTTGYRDMAKTYSSMRECSNQLNVPIEILRAAKVHPECDCFSPNGRINGDKIAGFIQDHINELEDGLDDNITKWKTLLTKYNAQIAEKQLEELQGKYILREEAEKQVRAIGLAQKSMLRSRLLQELPSKVVGLTVPQISVVMEQTLMDICGLMSKLKVDE